MMGYIHLYTGNGKGKTTAALGLALRAAGAGFKVYIGQFVKGMPYAELDALKSFAPQIIVRQFGRDCFIVHEPQPEDISMARAGLEEVAGIIAGREFDLVVLDEVCIALHYKLFGEQELIDILHSKADCTEVILTGRYAPLSLIELADLVTEMKEVKHYYNNGIEARKGIEF
jgi:cob(I)alamin adenosyltransferase